MLELDERCFDVAGKSQEWHTAFYYLAEHVRNLANGRINHKELYSLVGVDGRYVNHANPLVRKRTAGALSRIVHSRQYALDMRSRYFQDGLAFDRAASALCEAITQERDDCTDEWLADYLHEICWPDVRRGLEHEKASWRGDLDIYRAGCEMDALFASGDDAPGLADWMSPAAVALAGLLHILAFGHLNFAFARSLVDLKPTGPLAPLEIAQAESVPSTGACLVRFADEGRSTISGSWALVAGKPFTIGRYTDCDILETGRQFSRVHCCLYFLEDRWHFEDMGSRNGSAILRGNGAPLYDSAVDGAHRPIVLQHGDIIVLAARSRYWFGAHQMNPQYTVVEFEDHGETFERT